MNIEYEYTIEDIIEAQLFHRDHSPAFQRQALIGRIIPALLVIPIMLGMFYVLNQSLTFFGYESLTISEQQIFTIFACISALGASAIAFFRYPHTERKHIVSEMRKVLNEGDNKTKLGLRAISLSEEGIFTKTQVEESKLNWASIHRVAQNEKYAFLYMSSTDVIIIPKRAFLTEKLLQEFLNYVNSHIT